MGASRFTLEQSSAEIFVTVAWQFRDSLVTVSWHSRDSLKRVFDRRFKNLRKVAAQETKDTKAAAQGARFDFITNLHYLEKIYWYTLVNNTLFICVQ